MTKQEEFTKYLLELQSKPKQVADSSMLLNPKLLNASDIRAKLPTLLDKYTFRETKERSPIHSHYGTQTSRDDDFDRAIFNKTLQD